MAGAKPVRLLVKVPVPVPSLALKLVKAGLAVVVQQTPSAITASFPSEVIFPPDTAVVSPIEVAITVVSDGKTIGIVVAVTSFPYAVPARFVA